MALSLRPGAETKFYVSAGVPATINAAGYAALTWTEVKGLDASVGISTRRESGSFDALSGGRQKYRTILDSPDETTNFADLPADPGQILIAAAFNATVGSAAETLSMRSEASDGKGQYARGSVAAWRRMPVGAQDIYRREFAPLIDPSSYVEY